MKEENRQVLKKNGGKGRERKQFSAFLHVGQLHGSLERLFPRCGHANLLLSTFVVSNCKVNIQGVPNVSIQ